MGVSIAELKNNLHKFVVETDDRAVLQYVERIFINMAVGDDWWGQLSDQDKASVDRGVEQLDAGNSRSHDEVMAKAKELIASRG